MEVNNGLYTTLFYKNKNHNETNVKVSAHPGLQRNEISNIH